MEWETDAQAVQDASEQLRSRLRNTIAAEQKLREYFDPSGGYSGGSFERLGQDAHSPNEIGCHDILSLTLLGVSLPGLLTRDLLSDQGFADDVSEVLGWIRNSDLWSDDADRDLDAANELWTMLRRRALERRGGAGDTKLSKLIARKRPRLIPISDDIVRNAIPLPRGLNRWTAYRTILRAFPDVREDAEALRARVPDSSHASVLRVLDVIVWMPESGGGRIGA